MDMVSVGKKNLLYRKYQSVKYKHNQGTVKQIHTMKLTFCVGMLLAFFLAGCSSSTSPITPTRPFLPLSTVVALPTSTLTPLPSPTPTMTATIEFSPTPTPTPTIMPQNTLEPTEAAQAILSLLRDEVDCQDPCIWGIVPEQTTLPEALGIVQHLGLEPLKIINNQGPFYDTDFKFENSLRTGLGFEINNDVVKNISLSISPSKSSQEPRAWLAYSPETLINRYGSPSNVYLFLSRGPLTGFVMFLYFKQVNLSMLYDIRDLGNNIKICPITNEFDYIEATLGKSKLDLYLDGVPLEKGTGMTIEEFSKKMTGDPNKACFYIKPENFPLS